MLFNFIFSFKFLTLKKLNLTAAGDQTEDLVVVWQAVYQVDHLSIPVVDEDHPVCSVLF